jgi:hypothetical protein
MLNIDASDSHEERLRGFSSTTSGSGAGVMISASGSTGFVGSDSRVNAVVSAVAADSSMDVVGSSIPGAPSFCASDFQ